MKLKLTDLKLLGLKMILVLSLSVYCVELHAQFIPETFSTIRTGKQVKTRITQTGGYSNYQDTVVDDKYSSFSGTSWNNDFKHKSVLNRITISIKDTNRAIAKFDYLFNITVDTWDNRQRHGNFTIVMRFSYDPASHKAYTDKSVYQFYNSHKFCYKITSIQDSTLTNPSSFSISNIKTNFTIESEIIIERFYKYTPDSTSVNSLSHTFISASKLQISWQAPSQSAPNQYELEWAYIDTSGIKPDSIKYNFKTNSSRVLLSGTSYVINTVYDAGTIIYRVRRVRPDSVYFKYSRYSNWKPSKIPVKGYLKNYPVVNKAYVSSHEGMQKNWDYQVAFAEEGLKKEVVNYFDGSLKRRQGVTLLNTNNITLVDESIYDNHGRESIKIIPAPTDSSTLKYYRNFNRNSDGQPYSSMDFDSSTTMGDKCNGNYKAEPLSNASGAGKYYSSNNSNTANENAAIPDADGYPMTQTQLMPDPTGRVASQGGVGRTHQLGSGHETKYTYGTASQEEMDKLFGSEMGIANHYKKNAVIDPNGQMSISYIDQHGRVVATALSGGVSANMDSLSNFKRSEFKMTDLKNNTAMVNNAIVTKYDFDVISSGTHKIYYKLQAPDFTFGCVNRKVCYSCKYNIEIILNDNCGENHIHFKGPIGKLYDTACNTSFLFNLKDSVGSIGPATVSLSGDSISFSLDAGHYNLYKILTVNSDSISGRIDKILENDSNCYKTLSDFIQEEMSQIDSSECECDTCQEEMSYCESRKQLMIEDISPEGQYFTFGDNYAVPDSTSVLRELTVPHPPKYYLYNYLPSSGFRDENGKLDSVLIGSTLIQPNKLQLYNFTTYWKPSWAEGLLPMHPEYCYYKYCIDSLDPSYEFDENMMAVEHYDTAVKYGYFDPLDYKSEYTSIHDPLFFKDATHLNKKGGLFKALLQDLSGYTVGAAIDPLLTGAGSVDLWQFSRAIGYCQNVTDSLERQSCFKFYYDNYFVKNNWMNDRQDRDDYWNKFKTLYFQMKQKFMEEYTKDPVNIKLNIPYCVPEVGPNCANANYRDKISHFSKYNIVHEMDLTVDDSIAAMKAELLDSFQRIGSCEADIAHWDNALSLCENYSAHRDSILFFLLKVCKAGSLNTKTPEIIGGSDILPSVAEGHRFTSFEQVLEHFIGSNYKTELCNIDLINSPRSSYTDYTNNKPTDATPCVCNKLKEEIKLFKGCYSKKDTAELSTEGLLVNDFMNALVSERLWTLTTEPSLGSISSVMLNVGNRLFAPVIGGSAYNIKIKLLSQTDAHIKTFAVYHDNGTASKGCNIRIELPGGFNFYHIDSTKKAVIKPISPGVFQYTIYYTNAAPLTANIYNTCFTNIGKCTPFLAANEIDTFTKYFNQKFGSELENDQMVQLVAECGAAILPNFVSEDSSTYFYKYTGTCPEIYKGAGALEYSLVNAMNHMMRPTEYWKAGTGRVSGDEVKRYLTTVDTAFHCSGPPYLDFMTQAPYYGQYKSLAGTISDNYWWVNSVFQEVTTTFLGTTYIDTIWKNNYNKDPYFVGGFWIGAKCDVRRDSTCFTSFGDPYKHLGTSGRPVLTEIDSLHNWRWSNKLNMFIITAYDRTHPADSVILTVSSSCKPRCQILSGSMDKTISFKSVYLKPGTSGANTIKDAKVVVGMNFLYTMPFMDMINGLARTGKLADTTHETDIRIYRRTIRFPDYYESLIPVTGGYNYKADSCKNKDSVLIGRLGYTGSGRQYCKFGFIKTGNDRSLNFSDIEVFKDIAPDEDAIADALANDQLNMAGYHFTIQAGIINSPGDTTWYPLRGWSSCWKFVEMTSFSANSYAYFNLPASFVNNCNCLTCPESKNWSDSLYVEYPNLFPRHPNYETIVTNYINRKLNNNLSFNEIQSMWDQCGVGDRLMIKTPVTDYRIAVANDDCIGHVDTALEVVMYQTGYSFKVQTIKTEDSTIYYLDFHGLSPLIINSIYDTINKYFSSPYCTATHRWKNYRDDIDIELFGQEDGVVIDTTGCSKASFDYWFNNIKVNLFSSAAITNNSLSNIRYSRQFDYELPVTSSWMAKLNIQALSYKQRLEFMDTLSKWVHNCDAIEMNQYFYNPAIRDESEETICLTDIFHTDTVCYSCDTFKQHILDYQYDVASTHNYPNAAMSPDSIAIYLSAKLDRELTVYEGAGDCASCNSKSLFICEQTTPKLDSLVVLLNRLAKLKKLGDPNYVLGNSFTNLMNSLKPANTVLNSPRYKFKEEPGGGWKIRIMYNNFISDVMTVNDNNNGLIKKFKQGTVVFKNPVPVAGNGLVSTFLIYGVDSLYNTNTYTCYMPGLQVSRCCEMPATSLCPLPYEREIEINEPSCNEDEKAQAYLNAELNYKGYIDSVKHAMKLTYEIHCLSKASETFKLGMSLQRYHTTLYYYDQAGNLIKTVPPQGVSELLLNTSKNDSILAHRNNIFITNKFVSTYHTLPTNYKYNSLNQLVWQNTPDGAQSRFWYDRLGRLMLSQNAAQKARSSSGQKVYSYTRYDALGRISEVGEVTNTAIDSVQLILDLAYYTSWLDTCTARTQITRTFYDYPVINAADAQFTGGQKNLRGRVSSVMYYDFYSPDSSQFTRATHYSYDIHGNVDQLIHDFPDMESLGNRYKQLTYSYDLISGKVHSVAYQAGESDQWFHRYHYDADNRLVLAETSTDSIIWDRDAEYKYYKHGPLARTLMGEQMVQGIDYAYTLHGWLKGVNSNTLQATRDIGKDGTGTLRKYTARDAYGFTLGYFTNNTGTAWFDGDYKSIATTSFEAATAGSPLANTTSNLYNGNITHMVTAVGVLMARNGGSPVATAYRYDQLNRISSVFSYNGINMNGNSWNSGTLQSKWKEKFKYDANGNITKLTRYSATGLMDSLTYNYKSRTNQLTSVDETVASGSYTSDIDDQDNNNYTYDAIGNLISDTKEEIDNISWNVYGKIKEITRSTGSTKPDLNFEYDAAGQRVMKIVKHGESENTWQYTWYVRDAQGNVMATYTKTNTLANADTSLYRKINNAIISNMNEDSLVSFIKRNFGTGQYYTALAHAVENRSEDFLDLYAGYELLDYDSDLAQVVLDNYCTYYTDPGDRATLNGVVWAEMKDSILAMIGQGCISLNVLLPDILSNDGTSNELLNALYGLSSTRIDNIYNILGGPPFPPPTVLDKITYLRTHPDAALTTQINIQFTMAEISAIISGLSGTLLDNTFDGTYDFCLLLQNIAGCDYDASWYDFVLNNMDDAVIKDVIIQTGEPFYMCNLAITNDNTALNKIITYLNKDFISDALREMDNLDISKYLMYIYKQFGRTMFNDILGDIGDTIKIQRSLTLDELHIYGSSRHGIHKPKRQIVEKNYELTSINSDGELDLSAAMDSTMYTLNYHYFKRTLTYKQYELTNHLGNVLATVLDRKTFVQDSLGEDTLLYYKADVATAGLYYAFGSAISEMQFSSDTTSKYRYGFNNQEKDDEIVGEGDYYTFAYRIQDTRLGRFLSFDPIAHEYPWNSPYAFAENKPIRFIDLEGREIADPSQFYSARKYLDECLAKVKLGVKCDDTKIKDVQLTQLITLLKLALNSDNFNPSRINDFDEKGDGYHCGSAATSSVAMEYDPLGFVSAVISLAVDGFYQFPNSDRKILLPEFIKNLEFNSSGYSGYKSTPAYDIIFSLSIRSSSNNWPNKGLSNKRAAGTLPWEIDDLFKFMGINVQEQAIYGGQSQEDIKILQEAICNNLLPIVFENHELSGSTHTKRQGALGIHFIVLTDLSIDKDNKINYSYISYGKTYSGNLASDEFLKGMKAYYIPVKSAGSTGGTNSTSNNASSNSKSKLKNPRDL